MKSSSENHENNNGVSCFANWLGFSLSPHMEMEVSSSPSSSTDLHQQQTQYYHPYLNISEQQQQQQQQQQINSGGGVCFENNGGFLQTPLTVMPLKSDGSLCIMEALTRSQQSQVPKLEDFLGSGQERDTMALSSDSIYYQQQATQQENHRHQQQQQQFDSYLSAMACQGYTDERLFKNWINTVTNLDNNNNNNHNGYVHHNGDDGCSVTLAVAPATHHSGGELQSLSLSMSPGSQSSCVTAAVTTNTTDCVVVDAVVENCKKRGLAKLGHKPQTIHRKSIDTFGQRTSQYRGVTKHRWTGRYEAHLWDNSCKKEGQTRKGRQVYLGGYDMEDKAARAYDLAALKYWGVQTHTNLPVENYKNEIEEMKNMTRQEYVAHLRRKSSGFSRGASIYRGVTRHHQHGRWQARIGRVAGNKDLYLGTFSTQEEAAEAYDVAAIKFRGLNAVTNFDINRYDAEKIMASNALLAGDHAKRNKVERIEAIQDSPSLENAGNCAAANDANASHWKRVLYPGEQQANINACINNGDYPNPSFSLALQDLVRLESTTNPGLQSTKLSSAHFSNASSLVTSLNSSREASPERNGSSSSSSKSLQLPSGFMDHQASVVSPWISSGQLRPVAHLPVFAAWGDA